MYYWKLSVNQIFLLFYFHVLTTFSLFLFISLVQLHFEWVQTFRRLLKILFCIPYWLPSEKLLCCDVISLTHSLFLSQSLASFLSLPMGMLLYELAKCFLKGRKTNNLCKFCILSGSYPSLYTIYLFISNLKYLSC